VALRTIWAGGRLWPPPTCSPPARQILAVISRWMTVAQSLSRRQCQAIQQLISALRPGPTHRTGQSVRRRTVTTW
jgi:hypothetical protein